MTIMELLQPIKDFVEGLEEKQFYQYVGVAAGGIVILVTLLFVYHYRSVADLTQQLEELNETRTKVHEILQKKKATDQKRHEVNTLLAQDENFKIAGYFQTLLAELNLTDKVTAQTVTPPIAEGAYNETTLEVQFSNITMRDVTMLLQAIERKQRVYTKTIEISTSAKNGKGIDLLLVIATLEPSREATTLQQTPEGEAA